MHIACECAVYVISLFNHVPSDFTSCSYAIFFFSIAELSSKSSFAFVCFSYSSLLGKDLRWPSSQTRVGNYWFRKGLPCGFLWEHDFKITFRFCFSRMLETLYRSIDGFAWLCILTLGHNAEKKKKAMHRLIRYSCSVCRCRNLIWIVYAFSRDSKRVIW